MNKCSVKVPTQKTLDSMWSLHGQYAVGGFLCLKNSRMLSIENIKETTIMKFFIIFGLVTFIVFFGVFVFIWLFQGWLCEDWERFQYLTNDPKAVRAICDPTFIP